MVNKSSNFDQIWNDGISDYFKKFLINFKIDNVFDKKKCQSSNFNRIWTDSISNNFNLT